MPTARRIVHRLLRQKLANIPMRSWPNGSATIQRERKICAVKASSHNLSSDPRPPTPDSAVQGKTIILLAALTGLVLGSLSVAYHHWLGHRAIAWWGPAGMELIAYAPRVDALK